MIWYEGFDIAARRLKKRTRQDTSHRLCGLYMFVFVLLIGNSVNGQQEESGEKKWGVVLSHPLSANVRSHSVKYASDGKNLLIEIFSPPGSKSGSLYPAVFFLTELNKDRCWEIYRSWPRLLAAYGIIGIVADLEPEHYKESVTSVMQFLVSNGRQYGIDTGSIGVYVPSHVPRDVITQLLRERFPANLKAVVLFCSGSAIPGPFRKDLPVLFVGEDQLNFSDTVYSRTWNEVQKSKAPWTISFAAKMPLFFDAFADNDEAKRIIRQTIYFFKNQLEPVPSSNTAADRDMLVPLYRADYEQAAILFEKWLQDYPDDQYANSKYAMMMFMKGDFQNAEKAYRRVREPEPVYRIDHAKTLFALGRPEEAEMQIAIALKSGKLRREPYASIGSFLYSINKIKQGVECFEKATRVDPQAANFYRLAIGHAKLEQADKAFESLRKAIASGLNSEEFRSEPAFQVLRNDERWPELIKQWDETKKGALQSNR